ncbi:PEP-CTERM sorting domain-containing protein [Puniceicoccus vermicola]|uniref:PEP-CTERM sorting domain-containing protein n=1 Tax=Puniceicoccus vermicola TaxID=388746 RepID=A0A7X1AZ11_9BACT|nr:PEP-CTERM sorting domain-containing protein [Puniceicoccus vermicola]
MECRIHHPENPDSSAITIENFSFSAVPEPSYGLMSLLIAGFIVLVRRPRS